MDTLLNEIEVEEKSPKKNVEWDISNIEHIMNTILDEILSNSTKTRLAWMETS
jgi:hypothetical protein